MALDSDVRLLERAVNKLSARIDRFDSRLAVAEKQVARLGESIAFGKWVIGAIAGVAGGAMIIDRVSVLFAG